MTEPTKTLRDEFAMTVVPTIYVEIVSGRLVPNEGLAVEDCAASAAYSVADAMLQARKERSHD